MVCIVNGGDPDLVAACLDRLRSDAVPAEAAADLAVVDPVEVDRLVSMAPLPVGFGGHGHERWFDGLRSFLDRLACDDSGIHGLRIVVGVHLPAPIASDEPLSEATSTAAVVGMVRRFARISAPAGITANVLRIGLLDHPAVRHRMATDPVLTDAIAADVARSPIRRMVRIDEVAAAAAFFGGPEAPYVTGAVVPVDGGSTVGR